MTLEGLTLMVMLRNAHNSYAKVNYTLPNNWSMCYDAVLVNVWGYRTLSYSAATKFVLQVGMESKLRTIMATADRPGIETDSKFHVANLVPPTPAKSN